jgi:hypothetical protein
MKVSGYTEVGRTLPLARSPPQRGFLPEHER